MGISRYRLSHLRLIRENKYGSKSSIKKYVTNIWVTNAEKVLDLKLRVRIDSKYFAILIANRRHKNILAFIDRETGEILRPKTNTKPHLKYQPKDTKNNINDPDGGMRYVQNVRFKYLP